MVKNFKKRSLFYFLIFIISINILFSGGWDIWVQTLTNLAVIFMAAVFFTGEIKINKFIFNIPFLLLFWGAALSVKYSLMPVESSRIFYNIIAYIIIFVVVLTYFNTSTGRNLVLKLLKLSGVGAALLNVVLPYFFNRPIFPNPNMAAGFYLVIIPLFYKNLSAGIIKEYTATQFFNVAVFLLLLYSLINTGSHIGMGIFGLSLGYYLIVNGKKKVFVTVFPVFLVGFYLISVEIIGHPIKIQQRLSWLAAGVNMFKENFFTGTGPGVTSHILPAFVEGQFFSVYLHSSLLKIAAEGGIITFIGFLGAVYMLFKNLLKTGKFHKNPVFLSLSSILVFSLVEYPFSIPLITVTVIILSASFVKAEVITFSQKPAVMVKLVLISGLIVSVLYVVEPYLAFREVTAGFYEVKSGGFSRARKRFSKVLDRHPDYRWAYLGKAFLHLNEKNSEAAHEYLNKSIPPIKKEYGYKLTELDKGVKERLTQYGLDSRQFLY